MSQFEQFALNAEAPGAALGTLAEDRGQSAASRGTSVAGEEVQVVSGKSDDGEEEVWEATTSEAESVELIEDNSSEDESKENLYKSAGNTSRPSRAAKNKALTLNYQVDAEDIDVEIVAELDGAQKADDLEDSEDGSARGGGYIDSSSDDEGRPEEEVIIKEAKTGLKNIECILWQRRSPEVHGVKEMRVKFIGTSYRRTQWVDRQDLMAAGKQAMVRGYDRRLAQGKVDPYNDMEDGIHPEWCVVERVLTERDSPVDGEHQYLVKWSDLGYSESTWESADSMVSDADLAAIAQFNNRTTIEAEKAKRKAMADMPSMDMCALPKFCNGRELRDYQQESLKWMAKNWYDGKNCILGDEMGLGKTAQSIACLEFQRQFGKVQDLEDKLKAAQEALKKKE